MSVIQEFSVPAGHFDVLEALAEADAELVHGREGTDGWSLAAEFETREDAARFREVCAEADVDAGFEGVYEPTDTGGDRPYGLTEPQYEALALAIEEGYYEIPRQIQTSELGARLGISDQAVTERLRRAIATLAERTLFAPESPPEAPES